MATQTSNLNLTKPDYTDVADIGVINDNFDILDGAVLRSALLDLVYPVGSIYMSVNSTSPATLFGGTWSKIEDTFLLAAGTTYTAGATGGEASHTLSDSELPVENGDFGNAIYSGGQTASATGIVKSTVGTLRQFSYNGTSTNSWKDYTIKFGGGQAHNNMPPYLVVNVWKRTA